MAQRLRKGGTGGAEGAEYSRKTIDVRWEDSREFHDEQGEMRRQGLE